MDIDEEYATVLLARLDEPLSRPSTVDITRAVRDGRRRKRIRLVSRTVAAVAATVVVVAGVPVAASVARHRHTPLATHTPSPSPSGSPVASPSAPAASPSPSAPPTPTSCAVQRLQIPGGRTMSLVTAGDPTGHYLAGRSYPAMKGGGYPIIIWHDLKPTVITIPGVDQTLDQITPTGDGVGQSFVDNASVQVAWAYYHGAVHRLQGNDAQARGINAAGVAVGKVGNRPVVWSSATAPPRDLKLPAGNWQGEAVGIDDDGTIVGTLQEPGGGQEHAYVWRPDGTVQRLPALPTAYGPSYGERVFGVYNGWATGLAMTGSDAGSATAVRWNLRTGEIFGMPDVVGMAQVTNRYGWTVQTDAKGYAVLHTGKDALRLPAVTPPTQHTDNIAVAISDDGRTIGGQSVLDDADRTIVAVVWHCT